VPSEPPRPGDPSGPDAIAPLTGEEAERRDAESVEALEHGGLPLSATRRIAEAEAAGGTWASDLSPAELLAVRGVGFEPVGLVLGGSVYRIAAQWSSAGIGFAAPAPAGASWSFPCPHGWLHEGARTGFNWEHAAYEHGLRSARDLAMSRMVAEAQALGAHGVVGVRLRLEEPSGASGVVELTAVGTAIRRRGAAPLAVPFTCHLSGQDFAKLLRRGLVPVGFAMGVAAIVVWPGCGTEWQGASFANQELEQPTHAVHSARSLAVHHLEAEAGAFGDGVVGVEVALLARRAAGAEMVEVRALGTAVRRFADEPLPAPPLPIMRVGRR
jgi:uncharacterized protein YbjQ (UPF0145 family)